MALTRAMLKSMGLEEDKITSIIEAHTETVDALKKERDGYKSKADGYDKVKSDYDQLKESAKNSGDYDKLKKEYDDYKADVQKKESDAAKRAALAKVAKDAGLSEAGIAKAVKYSDLSSFDLDDKGEVKDGKALIKSLKEEWPEYITKASKEGADVSKPPNNDGGKAVKTKDEILAIKDTTERQAAWRDFLAAQQQKG
ncbi:MAG: hypothetical protein IJG87_06490 [Ruminococcus sp.]|nr:hypothetical protein [Ruminococcus sp.]